MDSSVNSTPSNSPADSVARTSQVSSTPRGPESTRRTIACALSLVFGAGAVLACIWRPDALAALTLIPAWCWVLGGVISTSPAWRTRHRWLVYSLAALWLAFAAGWVEEVTSVARGITFGIRRATTSDVRP